MARRHNTTGREAGILSRQGELFTGGPPEAFLQSLHPAARFLSAMALLLGISLCNNPLMLVAYFCSALGIAVISFLNLKSIYRIILIPIVLLAIPSWLVAVAWYQLPIHAGGFFFLRTLASVTVAGVALHSIGLRRMGAVLGWLRLPDEIRQMWNIMVSQVAGFSELMTDMMLARTARAVITPRGMMVRRQIGRQMGILFSRTYQRGNQLAFAMDARRIVDADDVAPGPRMNWNPPDYACLIGSTATAAVGAIL